MRRQVVFTPVRLALAIAVLSLGVDQGIQAQSANSNGKRGCNGNIKDDPSCPPAKMGGTTAAQRRAARLRLGPQKKGVTKKFAGVNPATAMYSPLATVGTAQITATATMGTAFGTPDYFGVANWANSPLPTIDPLTGAITAGSGMRKFVDPLPSLPAAVPDTTTFPGSDYYEISLEDYNQVMHSDLAAANGGLGTKLRGYRQTNGPAPQAKPVYLGPVIIAQKNRPVRVKFTNNLPAGAGGNLFIPTDTTYMGAGNGPTGAPYTQNRGTLHLHGGNTPWISDGTPHQWTVPATETSAAYKKGVSSTNVPDMWFDASGAVIASCAGAKTCGVAGATNDPGAGSMTFYWTNQQSGRLMFYHDHAYGVTRLNVYAGEAAGYLVVDPVGEEDKLAAATVPGTIGSTIATTDLLHLVPLVIQDKTFVPDNGAAGGQLAATDPTWPVLNWGFGNLWFPHVYTPNQNPMDLSGANAWGRWDYGPWFWPPQNPNTLVGLPIPCPNNPSILCPGTPNPSGTPEGFMDTMVLNGVAYPKMAVDPAAYRFRILNAANDRAVNLQLYVAEPLTIGVTNPGSGYLTAPAVTLTPSNGAVATAVLSYGGVSAIALLSNGSGYTTVPNVNITGDGTGATATATIGGPGNSLTAITVTNPGTGYTFATVAIDPSPSDPTCATPGICATASATIAPAGGLAGIVVTTPPTTPFVSAPLVGIAAPTGTGGATATAIASVNTEVRMLPAVPPAPGAPLQTCGVNTSGGGGMGIPIAIGTATGLPANCWPSTWPVDGRDGGVPDPTTAGPAMVQIGTEGGLLPAPVVIPSTPVNYEYNRRSITVLNIFTHGLLLGPAERADVVVDFSAFAGKTLILYNDAPAPVPASDPRVDYYTNDPDQSSTGGAPSTLPGYGPNTRTIMQISVAATPAVAGSHALNLASLQTALPGIFSGTTTAPNQPAPIIPNGVFARIQDTSITTGPSPVTALTLISGGSGYLTPPGVFIAGGGGSGASAVAVLAPRPVGSLTLTAGCGPITPCTPTELYSSVPAVSFTAVSGGSGAAATAVLATTGGVKSISVSNGGKNYVQTSTTVNITGGGGSGAAATATVTNGAVTAITVSNPGSGYSSAPTVTIVSPVGSNAKASATLGRPVASLNLTNGGSGYNAAPTVNITGGGATAPSATATAALAPGPVAGFTSLVGGAGFTTAPLVTIAGGGGMGAVAAATVGNSLPMLPKAIQELFTLDYGRMNATLGVEVPFTNFLTQTTIPYGYVDPPTELFKDGDTQVWKITHNGVDTHFMHFHLFNVQVINRVGWDGAVKPPEPNEVGWKETVRMNPLEDIIVALNPMKQVQVNPTDLDVSNLPNSVRTLDVTEPVGYTSTMSFTNVDPTNQPVTVVNDLTNFGWEYVWHCHILGHEENDMMRAMVMAVAPVAPSNLSAAVSATLSWTDNSVNETGFTIQSSPTGTAPWTNIATVPATPGSGSTVTFKSGQLIKGGVYYRVIANNLVGYTRTFAAPAAGYQSLQTDSNPSNVVLH